MAKKKSKRRFFRQWKRSHRRDRRIPLSVIAGLGTSILAPPAPGWTSALENIKCNRMDMAFQSFVRAWTGLAIGGIGGQGETYFNVMDTLNPLTMNEAPAWKTMFWTALSARLVKKFTHVDPIKKIPVVGSYVKFS